MLLNELHKTLSTFENFCFDIGHLQSLDFNTISLRYNYLVKLTLQVYAVESNYSFLDIEEEIKYYKCEKPRLLQYAIFYERVMNTELEKPFGQGKAYYKKIKKLLVQDSKSILSEIKYYRADKSDKDQEWFTRNSEKRDIFALVKAFEMFEKYINTKSDKRNIEEKIAVSKKLTWTGTQAEYVEHITSLKETNVINNGNATLKEIHEAFQLIFNVTITDFHGTSHEIMFRQEPAKFCLKTAKAIKDKQKRLHNNL